MTGFTLLSTRWGACSYCLPTSAFRRRSSDVTRRHLSTCQFPSTSLSYTAILCIVFELTLYAPVNTLFRHADQFWVSMVCYLLVLVLTCYRLYGCFLSYLEAILVISGSSGHSHLLPTYRYGYRFCRHILLPLPVGISPSALPVTVSCRRTVLPSPSTSFHRHQAAHRRRSVAFTFVTRHSVAVVPRSTAPRLRQGTSYKYLMTGCVKGPLVVSYVIFPVEFNEPRGPFVSCIFNEIISIICIIIR